MQLRSDKGITIIENLIAVVLVAIVVSATIYGFASAQRYMALARHHYRAASYAREAVERQLYSALMTQRPVSQLEIDPNSNPPLLASSAAVITDDGRTIEVTVNWVENTLLTGAANGSETVVYKRY